MAAREEDKLEQSWTFGLLIVMLPLIFAIVEIFPSLCYLFPQFYDSGYFTEITGLFPGSGSCSVSIMREREGRPITRSPQVSLYEEGYITLDTARTQARHYVLYSRFTSDSLRPSLEMVFLIVLSLNINQGIN